MLPPHNVLSAQSLQLKQMLNILTIKQQVEFLQEH